MKNSPASAPEGEPDNQSDSVPTEPSRQRDVDAPSPDAVPPTASEKRARAAGFDSRGKVRRTRASAWWAGLIAAALLAIALLIFIAQNSQEATINYFGFSGQISLAVALLGAAASGVLLAGIPGAVRIAQLRRALKKNAAADNS